MRFVESRYYKRPVSVWDPLPHHWGVIYLFRYRFNEYPCFRVGQNTQNSWYL